MAKVGENEGEDNGQRDGERMRISKTRANDRLENEVQQGKMWEVIQENSSSSSIVKLHPTVPTNSSSSALVEEKNSDVPKNPPSSFVVKRNSTVRRNASSSTFAVQKKPSSSLVKKKKPHSSSVVQKKPSSSSLVDQKKPSSSFSSPLTKQRNAVKYRSLSSLSVPKNLSSSSLPVQKNSVAPPPSSLAKQNSAVRKKKISSHAMQKNSTVKNNPSSSSSLSKQNSVSSLAKQNSVVQEEISSHATQKNSTVLENPSSSSLIEHNSVRQKEISSPTQKNSPVEENPSPSSLAEHNSVLQNLSSPSAQKNSPVQENPFPSSPAEHNSVLPNISSPSKQKNSLVQLKPSSSSLAEHNSILQNISSPTLYVLENVSSPTRKNSTVQISPSFFSLVEQRNPSSSLITKHMNKSLEVQFTQLENQLHKSQLSENQLFPQNIQQQQASSTYDVASELLHLSYDGFDDDFKDILDGFQLSGEFKNDEDEDALDTSNFPPAELVTNLDSIKGTELVESSRGIESLPFGKGKGAKTREGGFGCLAQSSKTMKQILKVFPNFDRGLKLESSRMKKALMGEVLEVYGMLSEGLESILEVEDIKLAIKDFQSFGLETSGLTKMVLDELKYMEMMEEAKKMESASKSKWEQAKQFRKDCINDRKNKKKIHC